MKKLLSIIFFICIAVPSLHAQNFQWAKRVGGDCSTGLNDVIQTTENICSDSKGNVYFGISIDGNRNVMFGDVDANIPPNNKSGSVGAVLCYSCEGELQWYKVFFCNSPTTTSWRPLVGLISLNLIQDTVLLVGIGCYAKDTLMVMNELGEIDTIQDEEDYKLFWINCNTQNTIRMQYVKRGPIEVKDNKIYNRYKSTVDTYTVDIYDYTGALLDSIELDITMISMGSEELNNNDFISAWTVSDNKYYVLAQYWRQRGFQFVIGGDTLALSESSYLACFDSNGTNLWYRVFDTAELRSYGVLDIDKESGILYMTVSVHRDGLLNASVFAAYSIDGDPLFCRTLGGDIEGSFGSVGVLSRGRVAIGGRLKKNIYVGGVTSGEEKGGCILLYDNHVDRFILCEVMPGSYSPKQFCMDRDDNLIFASSISNSPVILGNDTLVGYPGAPSTIIGKYGWPCGVEAQWPEPVGIADVATAAAAMELRVYPNPARSGVWVERRGAPLVVDAAGNVVEGLLAEGPVEGTPAAGSAATSATLTLRNSLGQQLQQHSLPAGTARHYLSLDNLHQGLYLLEYRPQGEAPVIKKVIKR